MSVEFEYEHARTVWVAMYRSLRGLLAVCADVRAIQHQRAWLRFWTKERLWLERRVSHVAQGFQFEPGGGPGGRPGLLRENHRAVVQRAERIHRQVGGGCVAAGGEWPARAGERRGKSAGGARGAAGVHAGRQAR